jgi:trehalose 6-phosphate phosphatase
LDRLDLPCQQIGLFLDVDGTLLDLAPTPEAVVVPGGLREALADAEQRLDGALALLSGRPIAELDRLFEPLRLSAGGVHGCEIRQSPDSQTAALQVAPLPETAWRELLRLLQPFHGTFAENKGAAFAVHYRSTAKAARGLADALQEFVGSLPDFGLELCSGHRVFEIKPAQCNKGTAMRAFMERKPFAGRRPVFVADDGMDRAGFATALQLDGLAFSVGAALPGVSGTFAEPAAVRAWVGQLGQ